MSDRHLPVRPNLTQLKHRAKDLLRDMKRARPNAKLAEAQFELARSYGIASWPRLVLACRMVDAIWRDDVRMSASSSRSNQRCYTKRRGAIVWCAEALNDRGMAYAFEFAGEIGQDERVAAAAMALETYSRYPQGKHRCLELLAEHGVTLPDTPPMALHRGRIDLLEAHLRRDPDLLTRTFAHTDIYPPSLRCHADETLAATGMPLAGATLLHMCVDYDEIDIAQWLLDRGMPVDAKAAVDADGFGDHSALFGCVVTAPATDHNASFARVLLERGADPNARASLRKEGREYRMVTPTSWGERFHDRDVVNEPATRVIAERGGRS